MSEQLHADDGKSSETEFTALIARRAVIEQAKGLLMERYDIDPDAAFAVLARLSQHTNRKLKDVAAELVVTRRLPEDPAGYPK